MTRLKSLIKTCNYAADIQNDAIRDQVIDHCYSSKLRKRLLRERELTLEKLQDIEAAEQQSAEFENASVNRVTSKSKFPREDRPRFPRDERQ